MYQRMYLLLLLGISLLLTGCAVQSGTESTVTVVFEDNQEIGFTHQVYQVKYGEDLSVHLYLPEGKRIADVSYDQWSADELSGENQTLLTLYGVRYSSMVRITLQKQWTTCVHVDAVSPHAPYAETSTRLRPNVPAWSDEYLQTGRVAIGWNTEPDGNGTPIGFGSRPDRSAEPLELYLQTMPASPEKCFSWREENGGAVITACSLTENIVVPEILGGLFVTGIASGAFGAVSGEHLVLPSSLKCVEDGAFSSLMVDHLYFFDGLETVSDASFGSYSIGMMHVNAMQDPVYCGSYFDTLSQKMDYLASVADERKLILFCGSSARFGYDSAALESAFPAYKVVNMGVYAYANMLPQALMLLPYLREGDAVLSSPEMDAIEEQFCASDRMDRETWCMLESNYDLLTLIDATQLNGLFDAFGAYQAARRELPARSYEEIPSQYDEDRNPCDTPSYNKYGDYILHRPNNVDGKLFGVKRASFTADAVSEDCWSGLNAVFDGFAAQGVQVLFTWSPRSSRSITADSTPASIAALGASARQRLHAQVISEPEDALMDALYFYGTDNHLSTEGVQIHTKQVIEDLKSWLEVTP